MIGDIVRITGNVFGYEGRIGKIVDTYTLRIVSEYTGNLLSRDRWILELLPIDKEPIEEISIRPLDCTVVRLMKITKVRK